jgi:signal transduction histidine kinase
MKRLLNVGVIDSMPKYQARAIILTNTIAFIATCLILVYLFYSLRNGWGTMDTSVFLMAAAQFTVILLNRWDRINISRFLLTITIPLGSLLVLFLPRIQHPELFNYAPTPGIFVVLLSTSVIPVLIFSTHEKRLMFVCVGISFVFFASLDILLRVYSKLGEFPTLTQYFASNIALLISYFLLIASVLSLKRIVDYFEYKNDQLIANLNEKNIALEVSNRELNQLNKDIEDQSKEIQAQSEELIQGQESLMMAHNEIERQKMELEKSLDEKSRDLMHSNQQLINQNNELQQFSYTVSHNLRGPVASMLGLMNIHRLSITEDEKAHVLGLIEQSAKSLETIIRDLNKIVDIRNDKFSAFERVSIEGELELIKESLNDFITKNEVELSTDFQCREITSIKAYINSILYNLISNAIQYRSPLRRPAIKISTIAINGHIQLTVTDNGLGIDLVRFGHDVFKLYKRFHIHTQGKGLGLYLVKQQIEKLNGKIEIESKPDSGATFKVILPMKG